MPEFITVARVGEIPEGRGRTFAVGGQTVAVFRVDGEYFALDDFCPHMGASLGTGDVHDGAVVCDRHLWAFSLSDGVCREAPTMKAQTFDVRVQGDEIQVGVTAAAG